MKSAFLAYICLKSHKLKFNLDSPGSQFTPDHLRASWSINYKPSGPPLGSLFRSLLCVHPARFQL